MKYFNLIKQFFKPIFLLFLLSFITSCANNNNINFIEKDGYKQYKKDDGSIAQAEWVSINGNDYYFDMNGYLQTNKWIEDVFFVDDTGKKLIKSWYTDKENDKTYYLSSDGSYLKNTLATIDGKDYYFDLDGSLIKDQVFKNKDGNLMSADTNGIINNSNGIVTIKDKNYFIDKMGIIYTDGWKEIDKEWYYFNSDGSMKQNEWFEATYYFGNDGKMLKNTKSPEGYDIDNDGKVLEQYKSSLLANDFKYIYQEYCKYPWAEVGADGSFISIDSNPDDLDSSDYPYLSKQYVKDAGDATKKILKILGFPDYVSKQMDHTSFSDGKQTETLGDITVTWTYHPDRGIEIMFVKKPS